MEGLKKFLQSLRPPLLSFHFFMFQIYIAFCMLIDALFEEIFHYAWNTERNTIIIIQLQEYLKEQIL